jgi:hypothetical protein
MAAGIIQVKSNIFVPVALVREEHHYNTETLITTLNVMCAEKVSRVPITMGGKEKLSAQEYKI